MIDDRKCSELTVFVSVSLKAVVPRLARRENSVGTGVTGTRRCDDIERDRGRVSAHCDEFLPKMYGV
jgi:hypothetical protein